MNLRRGDISTSTNRNLTRQRLTRGPSTQKGASTASEAKAEKRYPADGPTLHRPTRRASPL